MFCREQVVQLRDWVPKLTEQGAKLVVIGNGSVEQARSFDEEYQPGFEVLTDPKLAAYRAAELKRNWLLLLDPLMWGRAIASMFRGYMPRWTRGDAIQQGGTFVIAPGDNVLFEFVSKSGGHHADPADVVSALDYSEKSD